MRKESKRGEKKRVVSKRQNKSPVGTTSKTKGDEQSTLDKKADIAGSGSGSAPASADGLDGEVKGGFVEDDTECKYILQFYIFL